MTRTFPYDPDAVCDICGRRGATDIYGDYYCSDCLDPKKETPMKKNWLLIASLLVLLAFFLLGWPFQFDFRQFDFGIAVQYWAVKFCLLPSKVCR